MEITFVHQCPNCRRRWQAGLKQLGRQIRCDQCGRLSQALDPDLESAAMLDSIKHHAELSRNREGAVKRWQPPR